MKIQYQDDRLIIFESALFRTTTTMIIGERYLLLVDPNWLPIEIDFIAQKANELGYEKEKHLLFTHSDYDHIIGYEQFSHYHTIASRNFVDNKTQAAILQQINNFDDEYYIKRTYPITYPKIETPISGDETQLNIQGDDYLFYQARGHNTDGIITFNRNKGVLIVGDYLSNIEFPYIYDSIALYQKTLDKLERIIDSQEVNYLISGHGDYTSSKAEMQKRISGSRAYIDKLLKSVQSGVSFDFDQLMESYDFPGIMRKFHDANIVLARKELEKN